MRPLLFALCLTACATQPSPLKLCAAALVTLSASAECTMMGPDKCMFTMTDWERAMDAGANKQAYCPALKPGEAAGNN